jgi:cell shape-determining protein MreC
MPARKSLFLGIVVVLLLFFIFFMPSLGMRLRGFLGPQAASPSDAERLAAENESLTAKLAEFDVISSELPTSTPNAVRAMVYSDYPLNFKNEFTVNAGAQDTVAVGDAVVFQGNLIGTVTQASVHSSVVQTIFDPNFKLPVKIGTRGYDALLAGGSYPMVESIAKTAGVTEGDIVMSAAPGMPYGIAIGTLGNITVAPDNLFEEASLSFPYDMGMVQTVEIVK